MILLYHRIYRWVPYKKMCFEYILDKNVRPRVCFGSGIRREVLPIKISDISPVVCYEEPPKFSDLKNQITSTAGTIGKSVRWPQDRSYQAPRRKSSPVKPIKQNAVPFNQSTTRKELTLNSLPGPGTYVHSDKKRELKFSHSFGGKKTLIPAVDIKCVPFNDDLCSKCGTSCGQQGDYWHKDNKTFLCRPCMQKLYKHRYTNKFDYKQFRPIRDCSFAHHHEQFKNSIKLMSPRQIRKKVYKEAYFDNYFSHFDED